ncbi:MAG: hypothetical protein AABY83_12545 [Pseudomonadota bacterium]
MKHIVNGMVSSLNLLPDTDYQAYIPKNSASAEAWGRINTCITKSFAIKAMELEINKEETPNLVLLASLLNGVFAKGLDKALSQELNESLAKKLNESFAKKANLSANNVHLDEINDTVKISKSLNEELHGFVNSRIISAKAKSEYPIGDQRQGSLIKT